MSKVWKHAWGDLAKTTQAITADPSVSQLQWGFDSGLRKRLNLCEHITEHCCLEVLQYAHSKGCKLPEETCFNAAGKGKIDIIE